LTGFLKGEFREKKGHQPAIFGRTRLTAKAPIPEDKSPPEAGKSSGTAFFFYRISPKKSIP